jgi:hypothetical protein
LIVLIATGTSAPAFGFCPPACAPNSGYIASSISVTTDKPAYIRGDTITVSGHVTNPIAGEDAVIMGIDPSLDDIFVTQLPLDNNGNYTTKINTASSLMAENGQYEILAQYHSEQGTLTVQTQFTVTGSCLGSQCSAPTNATTTIQIPQWIHNNAKLWSEGAITNNDFIQGIQYLIEQKIIAIPPTQPVSVPSNQIPVWFKNNAGWWADGQISDDEFVKVIQWLVSSGIIKV